VEDLDAGKAGHLQQISVGADNCLRLARQAWRIRSGGPAKAMPGMNTFVSGTILDRRTPSDGLVRSAGRNLEATGRKGYCENPGDAN
jgi:hypothetical protein